MASYFARLWQALPLDDPPKQLDLTLAEALAQLVRRGEITEEEAAALWAGEDSDATRARYQQEYEA